MLACRRGEPSWSGGDLGGAVCPCPIAETEGWECGGRGGGLGQWAHPTGELKGGYGIVCQGQWCDQTNWTLTLIRGC